MNTQSKMLCSISSDQAKGLVASDAPLMLPDVPDASRCPRMPLGALPSPEGLPGLRLVRLVRLVRPAATDRCNLSRFVPARCEQSRSACSLRRRLAAAQCSPSPVGAGLGHNPCAGREQRAALTPTDATSAPRSARCVIPSHEPRAGISRSELGIATPTTRARNTSGRPLTPIAEPTAHNRRKGRMARGAPRRGRRVLAPVAVSPGRQSSVAREPCMSLTLALTPTAWVQAGCRSGLDLGSRGV